MDKRRGVCQCCGYPTLPLRDFPQMPTFDICILCDWQDEGQSDKDADKIYGGANKSYSLTNARINFNKDFTMFSIDAELKDGKVRSEKLELKKSLINLFNKLKKISDKNEENKIWIKILKIEERLHQIKYETIE
ncbi:CPCC family cysteine-rich protein [Anaerosinus gibii]|uniref:CPCC family cysteine-rich protein n=1 Tax=Selenobaculum gibii TaxID=3054208 RepID=A0A9Y2AHQ0_9FIRM|nr:CPCC family cysteine-rich protein [Selenobaculum gbiensis]WIW70181.1 CPCC family cysteine-rich protein [Selenobaculum gbiensis]